MTDTLSPAEFADAVGVTAKTVRNWLKRKYVKFSRVGPRGHIRIPADQVGKVLGIDKPKAAKYDHEASMNRLRAAL